MSMGRPTKLTDELKADILKFIEGGSFVEDACILAGVHKSQFYRWKKRAEDEEARVAENPKQRKIRKSEQPFIDFRDATTRARTCAKNAALKIIMDASVDRPFPKREDDEPMTRFGDWRASAWFLEKSFPAEYGKQQKVELTGSVDTTQTRKVVYRFPENGRGPK